MNKRIMAIALAIALTPALALAQRGGTGRGGGGFRGGMGRGGGGFGGGMGRGISAAPRMSAPAPRMAAPMMSAPMARAPMMRTAPMARAPMMRSAPMIRSAPMTVAPFSRPAFRPGTVQVSPFIGRTAPLRSPGRVVVMGPRTGVVGTAVIPRAGVRAGFATGFASRPLVNRPFIFPRSGRAFIGPRHFLRGHGFVHNRLVLASPFFFGFPFFPYSPFNYFPYFPFYNYYTGYDSLYDDYGYPVSTASSPNVIVIAPQGSAYYPESYRYPEDYSAQLQPEQGVAQPQTYQAPDTRSSSYVTLAFKDRSFYGTDKYWVEDDNICFITGFGAQTCAPLDQLDVPLTRRLSPGVKLPFDTTPAAGAAKPPAK